MRSNRNIWCFNFNPYDAKNHSAAIPHHGEIQKSIKNPTGRPTCEWMTTTLDGRHAIALWEGCRNRIAPPRFGNDWSTYARDPYVNCCCLKTLLYSILARARRASVTRRTLAHISHASSLMRISCGLFLLVVLRIQIDPIKRKVLTSYFKRI